MKRKLVLSLVGVLTVGTLAGVATPCTAHAYTIWVEDGIAVGKPDKEVTKEEEDWYWSQNTNHLEGEDLAKWQDIDARMKDMRELASALNATGSIAD